AASPAGSARLRALWPARRSRTRAASSGVFSSRKREMSESAKEDEALDRGRPDVESFSLSLSRFRSFRAFAARRIPRSPDGESSGGRQQERPHHSLVDPGAGDLSGVVDPGGIHQLPAGAAGDQTVEVHHGAAGRPLGEEGARLPTGVL